MLFYISCLTSKSPFTAPLHKLLLPFPSPCCPPPGSIALTQGRWTAPGMSPLYPHSRRAKVACPLQFGHQTHPGAAVLRPVTCWVEAGIGGQAWPRCPEDGGGRPRATAQRRRATREPSVQTPAPGTRFVLPPVSIRDTQRQRTKMATAEH
jgi:hypothetical protein